MDVGVSPQLRAEQGRAVRALLSRVCGLWPVASELPGGCSSVTVRVDAGSRSALRFTPTPQIVEWLELLAALGLDAHVAPEPDANVASGEESVVLASFASLRGAEHMITSLGRGFRKEHRKGHAMALVISGNEDGSLKLTQSRALSASGVAYTGMRISLSVAMGFMGMLSSLRGAKGGINEVRHHGSHVGADEQQTHAILARAGPHAALVLVACNDHENAADGGGKAADQASESWDASRTEFLAELDPGPKHDRVRTALRAPSSTSD